MQPNDITFFSTFPVMTFWLGVKPSPSATSLNRTSKTGDVLRVGRFEDDGYFLHD